MSKIFYHVVWSNQSSLEKIITAIENDDSYTNVVIFGPEEYEPGIHLTATEFIMLKRFLEFHNVKLTVILGSPNEYTLNYKYSYRNFKELRSWHTYFANYIIAYGLNHNLLPYGHNKKISKHFISLNGRAHSWRCVFIDYMAKYNLIDKGYVSWHNSENWDYPYTFRWWTPTKLNFDSYWINPSDGFFDIFRPPNEFKDSLFSVISESTTEAIFVTEKTYIPIYHKRPFLIYGAPYIHEYLKSLGFLMFDEIIDYSFDSVDDDEKRCEMVVKEVEKLCKHDISKLKQRTEQKVQHNFDNLLQISANKKLVPKEVKKLVTNNTHNPFPQYAEVLNISDRKEFFKLIKGSK